MNEPTPLIICGLGRSGTRNTADLLNAHGASMIHDEIPERAMRGVFMMLDEVDGAYNKRSMRLSKKHSRYKKGWMALKGRLLMESFGYVSKWGTGPTKGFESFRYVGHKTPKTEQFFTDYEKHFQSAGLQPRYIFCARNPESCWRSYKQMTWNTRESVKTFIKQYTNSFAKLQEMREIAPTRVTALLLDNVITAPDKLEFYRKHMFDWLELDISPEAAARIEAVKNRNSTVRATGSSAAELTDEDREQLATNPAIAQIKSEFFAKSDAAL